jgi:hypothetical protein
VGHPVVGHGVSSRSWRVLLGCFLLLILPRAAEAGGPRYIAGTSFFQAGVAGTPIRWSGNEVVYYTDLGDVSSVLPQADANALVAEAFARWTSVDTAALIATRGGSLDEDVNGGSVSSIGGVLVFPDDVQASAAKPLAIIYDADGAVTEALLGTGASAPELCDANAVYGAIDRFGADGSIAHARVVLNGRCAQSSGDLDALRYRLVRVLGQMLGLDWSQLNDSVTAGGASSGDIAGFPVMHPVPALCGWEAGCVTGADELRMDDRAAISRLYPVNEDNIAQFPAKQIFASQTARVRGEVHFSGGRGMQGVNVVARLIDANGEPSRSIAASSISGFLFRGDWGNPVTGYSDDSGQAWDRFGSDDPRWEGYYDLSGLEIPQGTNSATYQLTVEPVDPAYVGSKGVGPYRIRQIAMSGAADPVTVTVTRGSDTVQDIFLPNSAGEIGASVSQDFSAPGTIPNGGVWLATLDAPGKAEYYRFPARQGRVATLEVRALGDDGQSSGQKAVPVLGIWNATAAQGSPPAASATSFNTSLAGVSQLKVQFTATGQFTFGVADVGGAGRPDFHYQARLLYADTVQPDRASTDGGTVLTVRGMGFVPGMAVTIGGVAASVQSFTTEEIRVVAPPHADGFANIELSDPATGAQAQMLNALQYGGTMQDTITLVSGGNPQVPVGTEAPNPILVRVSGSDGQPVAGAAVQFTSGSSVLLLPCGSTACLQATNEAGEAWVTVLVQSAGTATIQATLASGASVSETVNGITSALSISALPPTIHVAPGSSGSIVLHAVVVENGAAAASKSVDFSFLRGSGTLSASPVITNTAGEAASTLTFTNVASQITVAACVHSSTACTSFNLFPAAAGLVLQKISGDQQYALPGSAFAPVSVRVLDTSNSANPVGGVPVTFQITALRTGSQSAAALDGEVLSGRFPGVVVVSSSQTTIMSDAQGMAVLSTAAPASEPGLEIAVQASVAGMSLRFVLHSTSATTLAQALDGLASRPSYLESSISQIQPALIKNPLAARATMMANSRMLVAVPEMASAASPDKTSGDMTTPSSTLTTSLQASAALSASPKVPSTPPTVSDLKIEALSEHITIPEGIDKAALLTARVLRDGEPLPGQQVIFASSGEVQLSTTEARTDADGKATVLLNANGPGKSGSESGASVSACLPDSSMCATFVIAPPSHTIASSDRNPPSHPRSCTTTGCSEASAPNDPRRGNRASLMGS